MDTKTRTTLPEALRQRIKTTCQTLARLLIARTVRPVLPLSARKRIVTHIAHNALLARSFLCMELLGDLYEKDPTEFHGFLWMNHARGRSYGKTYEISNRFGDGKLRSSRRELLMLLQEWLREHNMEPTRDVDSVFDVGCSLGYVLRFLETQVFTAASCLRGADVDRYAIEAGNAYLHSLGSRVELVAGNVNDLDILMGQRNYDVVLCCGVLMYLDEAAATRAVRTMLRYARVLLGLITVAHPLVDNARLSRSYVRPEDLGFVHNVDRMVAEAGGHVVYRKWHGPSEAVSYARTPPPLFILARPEVSPDLG